MHMRSVGRFKTCSWTFLQEQNACILSTSCTCGTGLNETETMQCKMRTYELARIWGHLQFKCYKERMNHLCFKVAIITTVYLEVRSVRTCLWSACCQSSFSLVRSRYNLRRVRNSPKMTSMHLKQYFVKFYENIFLMPTAKSCAGLCWFLYCPACMNNNQTSL